MYFKYCKECSFYNKSDDICKTKLNADELMDDNNEECMFFNYKNSHETMNEDEIICPYCGHRDSNSWEYDEGDYMLHCENCEKEFYVNAEVEILYSTSPTVKNIIEIIDKNKLIEDEYEKSITDNEKEAILSIKLNEDNNGYICVEINSNEHQLLAELDRKNIVMEIDYDWDGAKYYSLTDFGLRLVKKWNKQ